MKKVIALIAAAVALSACSTTPIEPGCRKGNVAGSAILTCAPKSPVLTEMDRHVVQEVLDTASSLRAAN